MNYSATRGVYSSLYTAYTLQIDDLVDNSTMDDNTPSRSSSYPTTTSRRTQETLSPEVMIATMSVLSLFALVGNAFVIFCFLRFRKKLKQNTVAYLISLAVSDLWIGVMTGIGLSTIFYRKWVFGDFFCQFTGFFNNVAIINSLWTVGLGSVDRCFAVSLPLRHRSIVTRKVLTVCVLSTWIYAMVLSAPPLFGVNHYKFSSGNNWCAISSRDDYSYFIVFFVGFLPIPMVTIITSYTIIFIMTRRYTQRQLRRLNQQRQANERDPTKAKLLTANRLTEDVRSSSSSYDTLRQKTWSAQSSSCVGGGERESFYLHASRALQRLFSEPVVNQTQSDSPVTKITTSFVFSSSPNGTMKMFGNQKSQSFNRNISVSASIKSGEERAARKLKNQAGTLLLVVTTTLLVSYTPMLVVANVATFKPVKIPFKVMQLFILLMISNAAVNPFIYFLFNREFRSSAVSLFKGKRTRVNSTSSYSSRPRANTLPSYVTETGSDHNISYAGRDKRHNNDYEDSTPPHRPIKLKFDDDIPLERNNSLALPIHDRSELFSTRKYDGVIIKSTDKIEKQNDNSSREKRGSYREILNDTLVNNMIINNLVQAGKDLSKRMTFYEIESTL